MIIRVNITLIYGSPITKKRRMRQKTEYHFLREAIMYLMLAHKDIGRHLEFQNCEIKNLIELICNY